MIPRGAGTIREVLVQSVCSARIGIPVIARLLKRSLALLAILVLLPYAASRVYQFPDPVRFAGSSLLNPYANAPGAWQRANFHAHGRAWNGLTNGRQSDQEIVDTYRSVGYTIPGVSNYQRIAAHQGIVTIPAYEHGYNIGKHHQLAIGAHAVDWFDFPLWQTLSDEQFVIDRVHAKADLVALTHPSVRDAYSGNDLRQLTGYELLEVVNGWDVMEDSWDAALSAGHLVWALANDDTHDLTDRGHTLVAWNMIGAATTSTPDVVAALRSGRTFAVLRTGEQPGPSDTIVPHVSVSDRTLVVTRDGAPSTFQFVGQNGAIRKSVKHATSATYTFATNDPYMRTVIVSPDTTTFVNPVVRYDGFRTPAARAAVDPAGTWLARGAYVTAAGTAFTILVRRRTRPRRRIVMAPLEVPDARRKPA